jgi:hypothetical protein
MNVCAPSQPFGYNRLGGKFISLASLDLIKLWERKYRTKVVGITTTSLHGSQSQYNGMGRYWKHLGTTSGTMFYKPKRDEYLFWRNWLANNYPELYDDLSSRTSPTQGYLAAIYRILGISGKEYFHNHRKGVFFCPLYSNAREFLNDKISIDKLEPINFDDWKGWWMKKSNERLAKLKADKRVQSKHLFNVRIKERDLDNYLMAKGVM